MFRVWILMPAIVAAIFALGSFYAFTSRLRRAHPQLWEVYRHLFFRSLTSQSRSEILSKEVFAQITDQRALTLRAVHRVCFVVYAVLAILSGLLLLVTLPMSIA